MQKKGAEQLKRISAYLSFTIVGIILIVNIDSATVDIFTEITEAITEPFTLLLFGSVLICLAKVGRKKAIKKEKGIEHLDIQHRADSIEKNDRWDGWYTEKHVTETLGDN